MDKEEIFFNTIRFGQQSLSSYKYFGESWSNVPISDFPHRHLLNGNKEKYHEYLTYSWAEKHPTENDILNRIKDFEKFILVVAANGFSSFLPYVRLCKRFNGDYLVIDGNHRLSIAHKNNDSSIKSYIDIISLEDYIKHLATSTLGVWGASETGKPYQSVFYNNIELVQGRRTDILSRWKCLLKEDLYGKSVIDLGCNIGANAFLAKESSVLSYLGVDNERSLLNCAIRLCTLIDYSCDFLLHDLDQLLNINKKFDTILCFAVSAHTNSQVLEKNLLSLMKKNGCIYFEAHAGYDLPDYFNSSTWKCDILYNRDGRRLYKIIFNV